MQNDNISKSNTEFWDELCGTQLAKSLGIFDSSLPSLKKFDDWYFDFYPYLFNHIPFPELKNKDVLEIGLGYGTVSQRLAESGANYTGLDIAAGPVNMVNHRLQQNGLNGHAMQGSILDPLAKDESFDAVIAIGCLHHTGDLEKAVHNCYKLLRPRGQLIFMVYYAYSYRRFRLAPASTFRNLVKETLSYRGVVDRGTPKERAAYDTNSSGSGAPHTDWISVKSLAHLCREFATFKARIENIDQEPPFSKTTRQVLLTTRWPHLLGLDLYATATK